MNDEVRGFSRSWARAIVASLRKPVTEDEAQRLTLLFHKERAVRGWDWLPDERETAALVARARAAARGERAG